MTPQEKAIELVDQYRLILIQSETDAGEEILCTTIAKQCALVAVNEIIESRKDDVAFNDTMWENASEYYKPHPMYLNYWFKIKTEIEKL